MELSLRAIGLGAIALLAAGAQPAPMPGAAETLVRVTDATAIVLAGEGAWPAQSARRWWCGPMAFY